MPGIAVVAHSRKSKHAPAYARRVAAEGADVLFVWGGDGTVQRCVVEVRFGRKVPYELDGGARRARKTLRIKVRPRSVTICVPPEASAVSAEEAGCDHA